MKNGNDNGIRDVNNLPWYRSCWKNRTSRQKKIIGWSLLATLVLALGITLYFVLSAEPEVCTTSTCVRTSMELLSHIDAKVDPCEDFYRFACGNFLENTNLDNHGSRSVHNIMEDEIQSQIRNMLELPIHSDDPISFNLAKKFYGACMNESAVEAKGLKRMKQIFKQIGGWPSLDGNNWRENQFDWMTGAHKLRQLGINFGLFFIISVEKDKFDPTKNILTIQDPFCGPSEVSDDVKRMYLDYMVDVAVLFGADHRRARSDSLDVLTFLLKLAKLSEDSSDSNETDIYNPLSISELQYQYPSISWFDYINGILAPAERLTYDDVISVPNPSFCKKLENLLKVTPKRTLANFISWHTLQYLINYLPAEILDRAYEYLGKVNGKNTRKPRWKTCVKATEDRLDSVISTAYVENYFDEDTRHRVIDMIRNIKIQFKFILLKLDWLDEKTKNMALEKLLTSVEDIISYREIIENVEKNSIYNEVEVEEDHFLTSALNLDYVNKNIEYGKLRKIATDNSKKQRGFVTGLDIVFSPKENVLSFPIGRFRGIYYQRDRPEYMNYGVLGSIIAHEISHIFIEAEYRDLQGKLRSWWSPHSLVNYEEKLRCLENQYDKFIVPELGTHLNTSKTRDEDMADLAGMKVSYDTYINWVHEHGAEPRLPGLNYSPNQLFWISSAIHHCSKYSSQTLQRYIANYQQSPEQFRVNGPLQNLEEFAFDFGCPPTTKMNPVDKCVIW